MRPLPLGTTRLSHPKAPGSRRFGRIPGLARLSLMLGIVAPLACVVSDPAEYGVAKQTPPFLNATGATPKVQETKSVKFGDRLDVNVPLRSEDAGEELRALLVLHKPKGTQVLLTFRDIPPGKLEDQRSISISAEIQEDPGCYAVSLSVMHKSSYDEEKTQSTNPDDTAILTWWLNVDDEGSNLLGDCPKGGGST